MQHELVRSRRRAKSATFNREPMTPSTNKLGWMYCTMTCWATRSALASVDAMYKKWSTGTGKYGRRSNERINYSYTSTSLILCMCLLKWKTSRSNRQEKQEHDSWPWAIWFQLKPSERLSASSCESASDSVDNKFWISQIDLRRYQIVARLFERHFLHEYSYQRDLFVIDDKHQTTSRSAVVIRYFLRNSSSTIVLSKGASGVLKNTICVWQSKFQTREFET